MLFLACFHRSVFPVHVRTAFRLFIHRFVFRLLPVAEAAEPYESGIHHADADKAFAVFASRDFIVLVYKYLYCTTDLRPAEADERQIRSALPPQPVFSSL